MNSIVHIIGMTSVLVFIYIILFGAVEYIQLLKIFPGWKYIIPFLLGGAFSIFFAVSNGGIAWGISILAICIAGWYGAEGMKRGFDILNINDEKHREKK